MALFNFNRKTICPVTEDDKKQIEDVLERLIFRFGKEHFISHQTITPSHDIYKSGNPEELITNLIKIIKPGINDFEIEIFEDHKSAVWTATPTLGKYSEQEFFIEPLKNKSSKSFKIFIAKSLLSNVEWLIGTAAEQLCRLKLNESNFRIYKNEREIFILKITSMFFGFGIASTNNTFLVEPEWTSSSPIMLETAAYAFALLTWIRKEEASTYQQYMNTDARPYYKKSFQYLVETNDTLLTEEYINSMLNEKRDYEEASASYLKNDFEGAVREMEKLLRQYPQNSVYHNNIGYYKLRLEKFNECIEHFNTAISIRKHPFYYNNLGFAQLMVGNLEDGYKNLMYSIGLDPNNSLVYRNLAVYSTMMNDYSAARFNFEKALTLDSKAELVHYYYALSKLKEGDKNEAINELKLSASLGEPEGVKKLKELTGDI